MVNGGQDMALYDMTKNIVAGNPVRAFNWGLMKRDFTYISDIISGIKLCIFNQDIPSNEIFNIGRGRQVDLMHFINRIGIELNKTRYYKNTTSPCRRNRNLE